MMIVIKSELEYDSSQKFFYSGSVFSGVIAEVVGGVVNATLLCYQGEVVGDYTLPFPLYETSKLGIDADFLEGDDEPFKFRGEPYNGVAFSFYKGECSLVKQYESGEEVSKAEYSNGLLQSLEHIEPDDSLTQDFVWDEGGSIKDFSIHASGKFQMALHFESKNKISLLVVRGDYFQKIGALKKLVLVDRFDRPEFLKEVGAGAKLNISGLSITDSMFGDLLQGDGLKDTQQLQIYNTGITNESFREIIGLSRLTELYVESDILTSEEVKSFKLVHPNCYVRFNGEEVIV
ncbi:hypothetical protein [Photobacterium sp. TY1-4]|uniref:hypothetical protein n=1 Tax=Photobacterium sp. TY1-4 TaxID=2899122 RepID=UPI0021BEB70E|nr:hypothetical protein [Photobacterium sp. TY1-4]UXI02699.1 hypothetical protein NH461_08035 [Photobacterium sp. TY1-4]